MTKYKVNMYNMDITVSKGNIHIENSYKANRDIMEYILHELQEDTEWYSIDSPFKYRSIKSMIREWITHNNLYKLGYKRKQTGSVDINYPYLKWYAPVVYWFLSLIEL